MPRDVVSGHHIGLIGLQNLSEMASVTIALCFFCHHRLTFILNFHIQIHYLDANASSGSAKRSDLEFTAPV